MKLKSKLWALAIAFAAVSCSEEMVNGPGKDGNDEVNGPEAYMKVKISTVSDGVMTKADDPSNPNGNGAGWGEDGNGWLDELPGKNEGKIHDINIFLVETEKETLNAVDQLENINEDDAPASSDEIVGQGYLDGLDENANDESGSEPHHGEALVTITMKTKLGADIKHYLVYTIVNAGESLSSIKNLKLLREYTQDKVIRNNEDNVSTADNFVMSTHKMISGASNLPSIVSLSSANTKDNPAQTAVYVERLAARIDLAYEATLPNDNDQSPVKDKGTFTLTGYMVVNQWQGKTNMFKQVTPQITDYTDDIADNNVNYASPPQKRYLGDEVWNITSKPDGQFNFVWSQEFYDKKEADVSDPKWDSKYKNHFVKALNESGIQDVPTGDLKHSLDGHDYYPIAYVRENTTNTSAQLHGYSTGMIFKTKFTPNPGFQVTAYESGAISSKDLSTEGNFFFITAEHSDGSKTTKAVYQDLKSVAARAFNIADGDTKGILKMFMEDGWDSAADDVTLQALQDTINKMSSANGLENAFKKYLLQQLQGAELTTKVKEWGKRAQLTYEQFVTTQPSELQEFLNDTKTADDYTKDIIGKVSEPYEGVYIYINGESYHKYWIRHDSNNEPGEMAAMEFAIVRNNVYLLRVTGVRGLGDPLPFTPGKDDPGTPDESGEITIHVTIYVMDWVKRNNDNIIL